MVVREGLEFYPEQTELIAESLDLEGFSDAMMASGSAH
jgi:hypothetical protein